MNAISPMDFSLVRQPRPLGPERSGGDDQRTELREAAQAFEAVLLRQMLNSARATDFGGEDLFEGSDDTFTEMRDEVIVHIDSWPVWVKFETVFHILESAFVANELIDESFTVIPGISQFPIQREVTR